jgi:hypothetical protein
MYTHVSKCKNNKIKWNNKMKKIICYGLCSRFKFRKIK